jgi:hypothetical protein
MEKNGVSLDSDCLSKYVKVCDGKLKEITAAAEKIVKHSINLASTKQVSLFSIIRFFSVFFSCVFFFSRVFPFFFPYCSLAFERL